MSMTYDLHGGRWWMERRSGEGRRRKGEEEGGKESGVGEGGRAGCDLAAARINKK